MPRGGKRMPSLQDVAETMEGDELDAILSSALDRPRSRRCGAPQAFENSEDGLEEFQVASRSYFAQVRDINRRGEMRLIPDVESWATYLGITRKTILNYEKRGEDWQNAIAFYKGIITACKSNLHLLAKCHQCLQSLILPTIPTMSTRQSSGYQLRQHQKPSR